MTKYGRLTFSACAQCRYFDRFEDEYADGFCRRRAPVVVLNRNHDPEDLDDDSPPYKSWFPRVEDRDWCGEFSRYPGADDE